MKTINIIIFLLATFLYSNSQSFEVQSAKMDTINRIDADGKKQGKWIIFGKNNLKAGYQPNQIMSEGDYWNNRKTGIWIDYFPRGNVKNKITFKDGRPHGPTSLYFQDGNVKEEGTWIFNRWVGDYKSTLENGDVIEIVFDDRGKEISKKITPAKKDVPSKKK